MLSEHKNYDYEADRILQQGFILFRPLLRPLKVDAYNLSNGLAWLKVVLDSTAHTMKSGTYSSKSHDFITSSIHNSQ